MQKISPVSQTQSAEKPPDPPVFGTIEPLEKSKLLLGLELGAILLLLDLSLITIGGITYLLFPLGSTAIPFILLLFALIHIALSLYLLITILLRWEGADYYITGHHLIRREGVMDIYEKIYELKEVSSVEVSATWLGQLFNYGTLHVVIGSSSNKEDLRIPGIANARRYGQLFEQYLGQKSSGK